MAARKNRITQHENAREKIKVGLLLKRLADHAVDKVEMSASQVRAAEILLKKTIPDLKQIEHTGDPDNPVVIDHSLVVEFVDQNS